MQKSKYPAKSEGVRYLTVAQDYAGQRVDNFLLRELKGVPKSRIYAMLRRGEVRINGGRVKSPRRLAKGDQLRIPPVHSIREAVERSGSPGLSSMLLDAILYEDDGLIVLNKPSGVAVHGGSGVKVGVIEVLRQARSDPRLELVHRLDRDTSGTLMVAKRRSRLRLLHEALRSHQIEKGYEMLVAGCWPVPIRSVRLPLLRYLTNEGERRVRVDEAGKPARTDFQIVQQNETLSWLKANLYTGRTHQIRVHALASGHPVIGDSKYGSPELRQRWQMAGIGRLMLHARFLSIPDGDTTRTIVAPLPEAFTEVWETHSVLRSGS